MPSLQGFIDWCINICQGGNARYSQNLSLRNGVTSDGHRYFDCSSFVNIGLVEGGGFSTPSWYPSVGSFSTYTMIPVLLDLGFQEVDINGEWKQGDILWRQEHTEVVYSGGNASGVTMGAHSSRYSGSRQVSINTYTSSTSYPSGQYKWLKLYRYTGDSTTPTKPDQKVSMYVIAAMCGNFMQESQVNPGVWENLSKGSFTSLNKGCGLGQWTNTGGDTHGRLYQMYQYCSQNGGVYDGDAQCDFIVYEDVWQNNDTSYGYTSLSQFLASTSTDIEALTHAWNINWEGIHDSTWDTRVDYARLILNYLTNHSTDQVSWTSVNNWITQNQQLQNCVAVYQHFNSSSSGVNPNPVEPEQETTHRVVLVRQGDGYVDYSPHIANAGDEVSGGAYANNTDTNFQRWVIRWPYDLTFNHTDDEYNSTFNFTMPDTTVVGRAYFTGEGYSASTKLSLIVTGHVELTATWYTQDGGSVTETINFDSNENEVYTYTIGITDDVHIYVNDGCEITPVTRYVPGWTYDESTHMYFFFQPDVDVTLNVQGTEVENPLEKQKSKWWMYMRPTWTWNQL